MPWNSWIVSSSSGANASKEWEDLIDKLKSIGIPDKVINKIELVAFVIKGVRTARWLVDVNDPEYCSEEEALRVAKKLTWLVLKSKNAPPMADELKNILLCDKTANCKLFIGHTGDCTTDASVGVTKCALCREELSLSDFKRDARSHPSAIQINHKIPLSRQNNSHNAENLGWAHRRCNYIQGEQTLEETIKTLARIVAAHAEFREE